MREVVILFCAVLAVGLFACRAAVALVARLGLIDRPNERSSHAKPTPRGGGLGILVALFAGALVGAAVLPGRPKPWMGALLAAALLAGVTGFLDDRRRLRPAAKGLGLAAAAALAVAAIGPIREVALPFLPGLDLGAAGWPLTIFWLVGFANAFNFMDGTDGIAALHAGVAAGWFAAMSLWAGDARLVWLAIPLSAASLSFLHVNWSPARVFMGDMGSLPIGLLLAALGVLGARSAEIPFVSSFLVLGPFLLDTVYTLARRSFRRENLFAAHRSHLYQRLVIAGLSHGAVALVYGAWTLLSGALGLLYLYGRSGARAAALGAALAMGLGMVALTRRRERARGGDGHVA